MGVDYGTKRVGIALSDGLQLAAHPYDVVEASQAVARIKQISEEEGVVHIVIGLPVGLSGNEGQSAAGARRLADAVRGAVDVPVSLADERFTSKMAERSLLDGDVRRRDRKTKVDKVAAAVMLQSVLDRGVEDLDG
jgi:putative Holliday junction resolvase